MFENSIWPCILPEILFYFPVYSVQTSAALVQDLRLLVTVE